MNDGGKTVGSHLIGQAFTRPVLKNGPPTKDAKGNPVVEAAPPYFQSRPSAAGAGYDPTSSGASNLGPENKNLIASIEERRATAAALDGVSPAHWTRSHPGDQDQPGRQGLAAVVGPEVV